MKNYIGPKMIGYQKKVEKALKKKKSLSVLKSDLQKVFNNYIRVRDTRYDKGQPYFICISCGDRKELTQMNAGHFFSVGGYPSVRYDEDNVHGQCIGCNNFQHGNIHEYRARLLEKIGPEKMKMLEIKARSQSKLMAFEVEVLIDEYQQKIDKLKHYAKSH